MKQIEVFVTPAWQDCTILAVLREMGLSAGMIRRLKQHNGIWVDGSPQTVAHRLTSPSVLTLLLPKETCHIQPVKLPFSVVFEDDWLMVVNKPAGMPVHPSQGHRQDTLANGFADYTKEDPMAFRPITRLDRYTSGLVLLAKNPIAAAHLCGQISRGEIEKIYYAVTAGIPSPPAGSVALPIGRVEGSVIQRRIDPQGKPALTHYEVVQVTDSTALVKVIPVTGRTHQIRVHMAAIGCPLQDDFLYGIEQPNKNFLLCCAGLTFLHPYTKQPVTLTVDPPWL